MLEILEIRAVERVAWRMLEISGSRDPGRRESGPEMPEILGIRAVERVAWRMLEISGSGDPGRRESGPEDAGYLGIWRSKPSREWPRDAGDPGDPGRRETGPEDAGDPEIRAVERLARWMPEILGCQEAGPGKLEIQGSQEPIRSFQPQADGLGWKLLEGRRLDALATFSSSPEGAARRPGLSDRLAQGSRRVEGARGPRPSIGWPRGARGQRSSQARAV
ncbi:hypothetical protein CTA1_3146 [Colletotrichum tanaceti]|uniref:Uncharacterized protein n=1 Tax=Colletotrichum tanaceti TaxID=1306861 RepID=A0A4U6XVS7_9PEZI|nr:hypothetical protein CTA1_3146 [Colletotrichum tanaceti]